MGPESETVSRPLCLSSVCLCPILTFTTHQVTPSPSHRRIYIFCRWRGVTEVRRILSVKTCANLALVYNVAQYHGEPPSLHHIATAACTCALPVPLAMIWIPYQQQRRRLRDAFPTAPSPNPPLILLTQSSPHLAHAVEGVVDVGPVDHEVRHRPDGLALVGTCDRSQQGHITSHSPLRDAGTTRRPS